MLKTIALIVVIATGSGKSAGIRRPAVVIDVGGRRGNCMFPVIAQVAFLTFLVIGTFDRITTRGVKLLGRGKRLEGAIVIALQHRVFLEVVFDLLLHLDRR